MVAHGPWLGILVVATVASFLLGTLAGAQTAVQSHPASEITAGDFAAGNYKIRGQLTFDLNGNPTSGRGSDAITIDADDSFSYAAITLEKPQQEFRILSKAVSGTANLRANAGYFDGPLTSTGRMTLNGETASGGGNTAGIWLADAATGSRAFLGLIGDTAIGFWGAPLADWGLYMNVNNGDVLIPRGVLRVSKDAHVTGNFFVGGSAQVAGDLTVQGTLSGLIMGGGKEYTFGRCLSGTEWGSATCAGSGSQPLQCTKGVKRLTGTEPSGTQTYLIFLCIS